MSAWTEAESGVSVDLRGAAASANAFVVVGDLGTILRSTDGISWVEKTSGTSEKLNAIVYANEIFLVVGENNTVLSSDDDGVTWAAKTLGSPIRDWKAVCYGNGYFLIGGESGRVRRSADNGNTFSSDVTATSFITISGICWSGSRFVAVSGGDQIVYSETGISGWLKVGSSASRQAIAAGNGIVLVSRYDNGDGVIERSTDEGSTWQSDVVDDYYLYGVKMFDSVCIAAGGDLFTSTDDGVSWEMESIPGSVSSEIFSDAAIKEDFIIVVGSNGTIIYKDNSIPSIARIFGNLFSDPFGQVWKSRG